MQADTPVFLRDATWNSLLKAMNRDVALRGWLGVKPCMASGMVEEHTLADRLGGTFNVWPEKWRDALS
jgi:hypothetical protein